MVRNPNYWNGTPGYERVLIRHMGESAAQLLAIQRGDIDVAFNLMPEQIASLKDDPNIEVKGATSLDFIYMAVAAAPTNPALQNKLARQAIGYAIDYDGIIRNLIGGAAVRPVSFLPVGVNGSTEELTRRSASARTCRGRASCWRRPGCPTASASSSPTATPRSPASRTRAWRRRSRPTLARVGIRAELAPMDQVNMRTMYLGGRARRC